MNNADRIKELEEEVKWLKSVIESLREDIKEEEEKYADLERACFP